MHNHRGRPTDTSHFVHILMRGHHASGGAAPAVAPSAAMGPSRGNMPDNTSRYRKGGKTHRRHHAEGDMTGVSPITGERSPDVLAKRKGGRACHAEGDMVATPQKRGGPSRRKRHAIGDRIRGLLANRGDGGLRAGAGAGPGSLIKRPAMLGLAMAARRRGLLGGQNSQAQGAALQAHGAPEEGLRRGGPSKRKRHADGDTTEMMARGGPKKKAIREPHSWGDIIGGIGRAASSLLPYAPLLLKDGGATKLATGGVGKIRRGMLSKNGKIIKNY